MSLEEMRVPKRVWRTTIQSFSLFMLAVLLSAEPILGEGLITQEPYYAVDRSQGYSSEQSLGSALQGSMTGTLAIPVAAAIVSSIGTSSYICAKYGFFAFKTHLKQALKKLWHGCDPVIEWHIKGSMMEEWLTSLEKLVRDLGYMYVTRVEKVDDAFVEVTYVMQKGATDFKRSLLVGICKKILQKKWHDRDNGRIISVQNFHPPLEEFAGPEDIPYVYGTYHAPMSCLSDTTPNELESFYTT